MACRACVVQKQLQMQTCLATQTVVLPSHDRSLSWCILMAVLRWKKGKDKLIYENKITVEVCSICCASCMCRTTYNNIQRKQQKHWFFFSHTFGMFSCLFIKCIVGQTAWIGMIVWCGCHACWYGSNYSSICDLQATWTAMRSFILCQVIVRVYCSGNIGP